MNIDFQTPRAWGGPLDVPPGMSSAVSDPTRVGWTLDLVVRFVKNILHIVDFGQLREYLTQP